MTTRKSNMFTELLNKIEQGDIPAELFLNRLLEMIVELNEKIDDRDPFALD